MGKEIFDFRAYQKRILEYRYKFFQLSDDLSIPDRTLKFLEYRYRAEIENFDEDFIAETPSMQVVEKKTFTFEINVFLSENEICEALDIFKKEVLEDCQSTKKTETLRRACLSGNDIFNYPQGVWEFYKKRDSDPVYAENTFHEWDRMIESYQYYLQGKSKTEILDLMVEKYLPESDQPNRIRKLNNDLEKTRQFIQSALKGIFPSLE